MSKEFSKKLLFWVSLVFVADLIMAYIFAWHGRDTSIFGFSLPSTGGVWGLAVSFYYNKAKAENKLKIQTSFLEKKVEIMKNSSQEVNMNMESDFFEAENSLKEDENNINNQIGG